MAVLCVPQTQRITDSRKVPKMLARSAPCQCPSVPAVSAEQCPSVPHQCHILGPTSAHQCHISVPI
ncbi:unnamed protein product [Staurois parvus]|uniref:Uncharacterized protein n=1 Tax=Staurois parvus TaxID=386267 RepID=A0ABN9CGK9_9NEOB|nr:unnamed protein product [Staurois parvus]